MKAKFKAHINQLGEMLAWIRLGLAPFQWNPADLHQMELASEEVLVNIIAHGYRDPAQEIEIQIEAVREHGVEISFKDSAPPFDPLTHPPPNLGSDLDHREIGGLGIHFIRQLVDEVRYRREGAFNILILVKKGRSD